MSTSDYLILLTVLAGILVVAAILAFWRSLVHYARADRLENMTLDEFAAWEKLPPSQRWPWYLR